jgi:hypothetical protein
VKKLRSGRQLRQVATSAAEITMATRVSGADCPREWQGVERSHQVVDFLDGNEASAESTRYNESTGIRT